MKNEIMKKSAWWEFLRNIIVLYEDNYSKQMFASFSRGQLVFFRIITFMNFKDAIRSQFIDKF